MSGASLARSWVERDLQRGDLSFLRDFAFFRNRCPPSAVVDRLRERGFLATSARGRSRMSAKGWIAILLRRTSARRVSSPALASTPQPRGSHVVGFPKRNRKQIESDWAALRMAAAAITRDFLADGIPDGNTNRTTDKKAEQNVRHATKPNGYRAALRRTT